jgi:FkbM family methyltransferase
MGSIENTRGLVRRLANQLGVEITRFNSKGSDRSRLARVLLSRKVNLIFDVGAGVGHYARELRAVGYRGRIISFEPVSGAYAQLKKSAARDQHWTVAPRTAIGSEEGVISIGVSANSVFSSALRGTNPLGRINANSPVPGEEQVPLLTLNSLAPQYMKRGDVIFLKIDVRGFEYEVLRGADKILTALAGAQLRLSFVPIHRGENPFRFMLDFMASQGFELHSLASFFADETVRHENQIDAIFLRGGAATV